MLKNNLINKVTVSGNTDLNCILFAFEELITKKCQDLLRLLMSIDHEA